MISMPNERVHRAAGRLLRLHGRRLHLAPSRTGATRCPSRTSLFVQSAVVSAASCQGAGRIRHDRCGAQELCDRRAEARDHGRRAARGHYTFAGDEHGRLFFPAGTSVVPVIGDRVELVTPHCDPTVNLHDFYHLVRGDTLVDIWPVDARGKR